MAKIAVELERALARRARNEEPGRAAARLLAQGDGWTVADVVCTSGPKDRPFEELHSTVAIAIVMAGSFQCHSAAGRELMTPGSLMLGNAGQCFECAHHHGAGDRCLAFSYAPEYFERLAADAGGCGGKTVFRMLRLPALRALSKVVALACAGLDQGSVPWEELGIKLAAQTVQIANGLESNRRGASPGALARVTRTTRMIERHPDAALTLKAMAQEAGLSPYHFLRMFEHLTGMTPHQYVLRARLRNAAMQLITEPSKILDVAFDCGFGDVSNFNRAFRAEFGVSPRAYRLHARDKD